MSQKSDWPGLSPAEWEVMKVLWEMGPCAARDVYARLPGDCDWAYKTVKTLLSRLVAKQAVAFDQIGNSYLYRAAVDRDAATRHEVRGVFGRLISEAFSPVLAHFIEEADLTDDEIKDLKRQLDEKRRRQTGKKIAGQEVMQAIDALAHDWFRWMFDASWQLALLVIVVAALVWLLRSLSQALGYGMPCGYWFWSKSFFRPVSRYRSALAVGGSRPRWFQRSLPACLRRIARSGVAGNRNDDRINTRRCVPHLGQRVDHGVRPDVCLGDRRDPLLAACFPSLPDAGPLDRQHATIDEGPVRVALEKSAIALEINRSPELRVTAALAGPFLFGVVHPCVVLPAQFVADASPTELSAVLTHELVHLRRRDTWIGWLQVVAKGCSGFIRSFGGPAASYGMSGKRFAMNPFSAMVGLPPTPTENR